MKKDYPIVYYSSDRIKVRGKDGAYGYYTEEQCDKYLSTNWRLYTQYSEDMTYERIGQL